MKNAVILCAGEGKKLWPYAQVRCKAMMPVSNKPIVAYATDALLEAGFDNIVIVGNRFIEEIRSYFRDVASVTVISDDKPEGTAYSLLKAEPLVKGDFLALYGDTIVSREDIAGLAAEFEGSKENVALIDTIPDRSSDRIGCTVDGAYIDGIWGHSRDASTHFFGGFALKHNFFETLRYNSRRFTCTEVGMMAPVEGYLEMSVADEMARGERFRALISKKKIFDIDKPWHILEANAAINSVRCSELTENVLAPGASIDESAVINGYVKLGKNSIIGKNVIISGNIIVGDDTEVINGAIISANVVIGDRSKVRNACFIESGSTVGNECILSHAAELEGMILDRVYLYHYMEWNGLIGENTDLGAATVCGSLRFDDSVTVQRTNGRRELNSGWGDAVFLGDYCRTGVNAIFMPGVKVGVYSVVGAGVLLNRDVPDNTLIYTQQTLMEKRWGSEKYGW